jgi:hypothetical protein
LFQALPQYRPPQPIGIRQSPNHPLPLPPQQLYFLNRPAQQQQPAEIGQRLRPLWLVDYWADIPLALALHPAAAQNGAKSFIAVNCQENNLPNADAALYILFKLCR